MALHTTRTAIAALTVVGAAALVASLPSAYTRLAGLDPTMVANGAAIRAGLADLGLSTGVYAGVWLASVSVLAAVFIGVGLLILLRRPADGAALVFAAVLIAFGVIWPNTLPVPDWPRPLSVATEALASLAFVGFFGLLFYFPDGRFRPGWTRWLFVFLAGHVIVSEVLLALGIRLPGLIDLVLVVVWLGTGVWAQVHRYRRISTPAERQQTKWVAAALILAMVGFVAAAALGQLPVASAPGPAAVAVDFIRLLALGGLFSLVPLAMARAVLRHRLWDIDPVLNRAVVLGGLTVTLSAVYAVILAWLGRAEIFGGSPVAAFVAAGVVAVLFEPLRRNLQRWANRLTYGQRDDPYTALSDLTRRLQDTVAADAVLATLLTSVRRAMRSPYAAVVGPDGSPLAEAGAAVPHPVAIPLVHRGEDVATLLVAPRGPGETFDGRDHRLLGELARQAGAALHAVQLHHRATELARQLQISRERLVAAREEERRRMRRDLHDGLGPTLAAQAMLIEAAHDLLRTRPAEAQALLARLLTGSTDAVAEVRRIAHDLRPPALDDLGLLGALRQAAGQLPLPVSIAAGTEPPQLSAAVEVAAYAIVREALTNVVRHSRADQAAVTLEFTDGSLRLTIQDDGSGPGHAPAGVGTVSMRERAQELGGTCTMTAAAGGGTLVTAVLPLGCEGTDGWTGSES